VNVLAKKAAILARENGAVLVDKLLSQHVIVIGQWRSRLAGDIVLVQLEGVLTYCGGTFEVKSGYERACFTEFDVMEIEIDLPRSTIRLGCDWDGEA
jgi:hypothetical protein